MAAVQMSDGKKLKGSSRGSTRKKKNRQHLYPPEDVFIAIHKCYLVGGFFIQTSVESFCFHPVRSACCSVITHQRRKMFSKSKKRKQTPEMEAEQSSKKKPPQALQNCQEEEGRCSANSGTQTTKLLLDVDCGVDDAQAIMLALASKTVEILGITCVQGNTTVENVCKNVLRVLQACNKLEIPVFKGAAKSILGTSIGVENFHGQDGLGDAPDANAPGLALIQKENAVSAMIRIVNENHGEVSLVATAPLTNLALAVRLDPSLPSKLKRLYIMGGNTESRGNTTVCAEFNFAADPEAAYIVLNDYQCCTYLASWEFTCNHQLPWDFCHAWLDQNSDKACFMAKIFHHNMEEAKKENDSMGFISCDSYAMAAAVDDSFITECDQYPVSVELTGFYTRGMMIVDTLGLLKKTHKVFIMKKVDMEKFKKMMIAALK